jgi:hypothetical protein
MTRLEYRRLYFLDLTDLDFLDFLDFFDFDAILFLSHLARHCTRKMGINGLMALLREKHAHVFQERQVIKGIAYVDTPLIVMSCGMVGMTSDASLDPYDLLVKKLQNTVHILYEAGAQQIKFVFDGPTRPEKIGTCIKRQDTIQRQATKRQRDEPSVQLVCEPSLQLDDGAENCAPPTPPLQPTPPKPYAIFANAAKEHMLQSDLFVSSMISCGKDVGVLKDLSKFAKSHLERNGMEVLHAPHDSESYIATLLTQNDVAVTCDSDALPFGCGIVAQNIGSPKETWINLQDVLTALRMDLRTFRTFCVMLGTDFNPRLPKCGPAKALQCITSFTTFENYCTTNAPKTMTLAEKHEWVQAAEQSLRVFELEN